MSELVPNTFPARARGSMFKQDMTPAPVVRKQKQATAEKALKEAYKAVDARDGRKCRVTGKRLTAGHVDAWQRLERDHLAPRSTATERRADVDNILTAAGAVHALLQAGALIPVDKAGEETTSVSKIAGYRWNRRQVAVGKEPFRLGRKEWKAAR